ncbi:MAG: hypothetical protein HYV08_05215 [Deltaproteobacteria bacterium]|nr:hypothetical protein [Deltaproteobacteria bacterium]MBI3076927.1 hypothetical protein [Deltaproteobacteria bacterium]
MRTRSGLSPRFTGILLIIIALALSGESSIAQEGRKYVVKDPFQVAEYLTGTVFRAGLTLEGNLAAGYAWVILKKSEYQDIWRQPNHVKVVRTRTLSKKDAQFVGSLVRKVADFQIPWYVENLPALPPGSDVAFTVMDYLIDKYSSPARELAPLIAEGGRVSEVSQIFKDAAGRDNLSSNFVYTVQVGKERRSHVLASRNFAIKIK